MAMPRSASAGGSLRSATRFSAASGSPSARARAAAVISESIEIPPHLSLPAPAPSALELGPVRRGPKTANIDQEIGNDDPLRAERQYPGPAQARHGGLARPRRHADLRAHGVGRGRRCAGDAALLFGL